MTAIQYMVHSRRADGESLAQIAQEFEFETRPILIAAASLDDAPPGTTDYVAEYHRIEQNVKSIDLARRYKIHSASIQSEAEFLYRVIKNRRRCSITSLKEWTKHHQFEHHIMDLIAYVFEWRCYGISLEGDYLVFT